MFQRLTKTRLGWQILAALANLAIWSAVVFGSPLRQYASWVGAFMSLFVASAVAGRAWDQRHPRTPPQ